MINARTFAEGPIVQKTDGLRRIDSESWFKRYSLDLVMEFITSIIRETSYAARDRATEHCTL
jgi:hypothetical protein